MVKKNALSTLIIYPLIHTRQKKKIALEIAVKVASVNWRLGSGYGDMKILRTFQSVFQ
jgi:hypothetical protein